MRKDLHFNLFNLTSKFNHFIFAARYMVTRVSYEAISPSKKEKHLHYDDHSKKNTIPSDNDASIIYVSIYTLYKRTVAQWGCINLKSSILNSLSALRGNSQLNWKFCVLLSLLFEIRTLDVIQQYTDLCILFNGLLIVVGIYRRALDRYLQFSCLVIGQARNNKIKTRLTLVVKRLVITVLIYNDDRIKQCDLSLIFLLLCRTNLLSAKMDAILN